MAKKSAQTRPETEFDLLSETQHRACHLISCGVSYRQVADRLGIHPSTLSEWQKQPSFRAKINELLKDAQDATKRRLISATTVALETLLQICTKEDATDRDRISAANSILSLVKPTAAEPGQTDPRILEERASSETLLDNLIKGFL